MSGAPGGVLVVGYGNGLRSDDGVGPAVAERLALDPRLDGADVRAAHQLTPELAFDASLVSLLVLVDAAEDAAPGAVETRRIEAGETVDVAGVAMTHHIDPATLATLARDLFGASPVVVAVSVGAATFEVGETLSPAVEAAVPVAVEAVVSIVAEHGRA